MPGQGGGGQGGRGQGGRGSGGGGMGATGNCVCIKCGYSEPKQPAVPCIQLKCPQCGAVLMRQGSAHHQAAMQRKK